MLQQYEIDKDYTDAMSKIRDQVIIEYKKYRKEIKTDDELIKGLEATISSKNEYFAKVKEKRFNSAPEFRDEWFRGLEKSNNEEMILK